jgi:hypothetical protein
MLPRCLVFSGLMLVLLRPAPDVMQFGRNISVTADQQVRNVSCVLCSITVNGQVPGRVRAFAGNVSVSGMVKGNILVFGGNVNLDPGSVIDGNVIIIGGRLQQSPTARSSRHTVLSPIIFLPVILLICVVMGALIRLTRRSIRGPVVFPPLPRL